MKAWGAGKGFLVETASTNDQHWRFIFREAQDETKVDMVADSPPYFDDVRVIDGVRYESRRDLLAAKLATLPSRGEPKDIVDAYFILKHSGEDLGGLLHDVVEKDPGFDRERMAAGFLTFEPRPGLLDVLKPYMIRPVSIEEITSLFHEVGEAIRRSSDGSFRKS